MDERFCRLCSTSSINPCLNIFSEIGVEMRMVEILSEHFKCDISEADPLPNVVCQVCWATTEAFHDLYRKSKEVQQHFLNSLVKLERDSINVAAAPSSSKKSNPIVEKIDTIELCVPKEESSNSESDTELPMDSTHDNDDNNEENNLDVIGRESNDENADDNDSKNDPEFVSPKTATTSTRNRWQSKKKDKEYQRIFNENKHLFNMNCEHCSETFESLDEIRAHYLTEHNIAKGYIKCVESGRKMFYRFAVMQHIERHLNPDKFKCVECDRLFPSIVDLRYHMQRHQDIAAGETRKFQCDICQKKLRSRNSLLEHKERHKNDPPDTKMYEQFIAEHFDMTCDRCDVKFAVFHDAPRHYKECHNTLNGYVKCCGRKLRTLPAIRDHINTHFKPQTFKCDVCSKSYATRFLFMKHLQHHKAFICEYCSKTCHSKDSIICHFFTHHVNIEPKFECQICSKKFKLQSLLKKHAYAAHREKKRRVTCELCGKSFFAKTYLDRHMLTTHTDKSERLAMREQCKYCGEWLMTKGGIYYHKQLHTSGIQTCEYCKMELPNRVSLMGHIRQHHRAHKHKCSYCEKSYPNPYKLRKHEESHTRHNIYTCEYCSKTFTMPSTLDTHIRRNHREEKKLKNEARNLSSLGNFK